MEIRPCWILCTPRSGSSYLCELLNNTGLFPEFCDPRLVNKIGPIQKGLAFNEWLRVFDDPGDLANNTPRYCKSIYHQYVEVMGTIPKASRRKPSFENYLSIDKTKEEFVREKYHLNYVKACMPGIKFIELTRDPISQTISTYFARKTNKYHLYNEKELEEYLKNKIHFSTEIFKIYQEVKSISNIWESLYRWQHVLKINYEELINFPNIVLENILHFLEVEFNEQVIQQSLQKSIKSKRIYKMTRPEASRFERILRSHINPIL